MELLSCLSSIAPCFFEKSVDKSENMMYNIFCLCGALVKRLRRGPLKAKTRVRFSYALPEKKHFLRRCFFSVFGGEI